MIVAKWKKKYLDSGKVGSYVSNNSRDYTNDLQKASYWYNKSDFLNGDFNIFDAMLMPKKGWKDYLEIVEVELKEK